MEVEGLELGAAELGPLEGSDQKLEAEEEQEESEEAAGGSKKRVVPGIVYLGHIPPRFRPLHVRNLLSAYGEVGRVFFQAEGKCVLRPWWWGKRGGTRRHWIHSACFVASAVLGGGDGAGDLRLFSLVSRWRARF